MKIKPNTSYLLVRPEARRESVGSILLPGNETGIEKVGHGAGVVCELPESFTVTTDYGDELVVKDIGLRVGDRVLFQSYKAKQNVIDGYTLIHYSDILGTLAPESEVGL